MITTYHSVSGPDRFDENGKSKLLYRDEAEVLWDPIEALPNGELEPVHICNLCDAVVPVSQDEDGEVGYELDEHHAVEHHDFRAFQVTGKAHTDPTTPTYRQIMQDFGHADGDFAVAAYREYMDSTVIACYSNGMYHVTVGNRESYSPSLEEVEHFLFTQWVLPENGAVPVDFEVTVRQNVVEEVTYTVKALTEVEAQGSARAVMTENRDDVQWEQVDWTDITWTAKVKS